MSLTCAAPSAAQMVPMADIDSVEVSLLTCGPGREAYSLYGHTAIRYRDITAGQDLVINYGMFSFAQDFFVLRFVFGLTDYQMGITTYADFMAEYQAEQRWVCQQVLNLTAGEKAHLLEALMRNYAPENRTYRYNFFYNNCTTRARDVIEGCLDGRVAYPQRSLRGVTFRRMLHQWNEAYPWCRLGNDLLLGLGADREVTARERQFLPDSLRRDFDGAYILSASGARRRLVCSTQMLYLPQAEEGVEATSSSLMTTSSVPGATSSSLMTISSSPAMAAALLLMVVVLVSVAEWRTRRIYWGLDALLLVFTGVCGLILLAMVFSQHPTVRVNGQILLLCPLSLVALVPVIRALRRRRFSRWLWVLSALTALSAIVGIWQTYDVAVWIVALSLLLRVVVIYYWCKHRQHI